MMLDKLLLLFRIRLYLVVALVVIMASILNVNERYKRRRAKKSGIPSHSSAPPSKTNCDEEIEISDEFIAIAAFDQESKSADSADVEKRNMRKPIRV